VGKGIDYLLEAASTGNCVCIIDVCIYVCMSVYAYACVLYVFVCMYYIHLNMHVYRHTSTSVSKSVICTYVYVCMYVCTDVYVCVYVCTDVRTHILPSKLFFFFFFFSFTLGDIMSRAQLVQFVLHSPLSANHSFDQPVIRQFLPHDWIELMLLAEEDDADAQLALAR